jgi:hypothetical protein
MGVNFYVDVFFSLLSLPCPFCLIKFGREREREEEEEEEEISIQFGQ